MCSANAACGAFASDAASAPLKASPAPVVSTACAGSAAMRYQWWPSPRRLVSPCETKTPQAPRVMTTVPSGSSRRHSACSSASSMPATLSGSMRSPRWRASRAANSVSFGVSTSASASSSGAGDAFAGAGLSTVNTPCARARRSACAIASGGDSSWTSSTDAPLDRIALQVDEAGRQRAVRARADHDAVAALRIDEDAGGAGGQVAALHRAGRCRRRPPAPAPAARRRRRRGRR